MLDRYVAQIRLLVDMLPEVAAESDFALKDGTAINLFYRDLPRLSVNIDLTWLPVTDRASSLREIDSALDRIVTSSRFLTTQTLRRLKPWCIQQLTRVALEL